MAFKMKNPGVGKTAKAAGSPHKFGIAGEMRGVDSVSRGREGMDTKRPMKKTGSSPAKLAGYWEYDAEGNPQRISEADYKAKTKDQGGRLTAGKRKDKGKAGTVVADMSHGKAEIDKRAEKGNVIAKGVQQADKYKKDVEEGEKLRGQRGTGKKTTRYAKDKKKQAEFEEKQKKAKAQGGSATPRKKY